MVPVPKHYANETNKGQVLKQFRYIRYTQQNQCYALNQTLETQTSISSLPELPELNHTVT